MSLFFWIVVGAALGALALGLFLKVRLKDQQVWEELGESRLRVPAVDTESSRSPETAQRYDIDMDESEPTQDHQGDAMNTPSLSQSHRSVHDPDLRRSSRVERPVSLVVLGTNRRGEIFQERTSAVSMNLHGCRYTSRHEYAPEGWVTLQVTGTDGANSRPIRARVRSVFSPQSSREMCQVGVELETPGNIWGIPTPPEDWQRLLGVPSPAARAAAAPAAAPTHAPLSDSAPALSSFLDRHTNLTERRAEVTVFPGPPTSAVPAAEEVPEKEAPPTKAERVVVTAEQLLQVLQGKLQLAAEKAVQSALASQLDETVKVALGKIEEGWHASVRQAEDFSTKRLAETQGLWEKELNAYRDRAEDIARRIESLAALSQQTVSESQKSAERFQNETVPQLHAFFNESFQRANSDFEAHAGEVASRQLAKLNEEVLRAVSSGRAQLEEILAQTTSMHVPAGARQHESISNQRFESSLASLRNETFDRIEKRLVELHSGFQLHLDSRLDALKTENVDHVDRRIGELNSNFQKQVDSRLDTIQTETFDRLEKGLTEFHTGFAQQLESMRGRMNDLVQQLEGLALESRQTRSHQEQGLAEMRLLLSGTKQGVPQEQLDPILTASREQLLSHLEWRLGEVSGHFDQLFGQVNSRANELSQQIDKLAVDARALTEHAARGLSAQDLALIEQSVSRASREFENAAARVSDRHLIRLMEQKQVVAQEASLELEARASEARALLQKASNMTLDEFRRRIDSQIDQVLVEAKERVTSSLASLDAESRAAVETRRRSLESDVARAAEQSTLEFRSGIKAFLYSCLVAAVSAVDQHAQTTLVGLSNDPANIQRTLEPGPSPAAPKEPTQFPPETASSSD